MRVDVSQALKNPGVTYRIEGEAAIAPVDLSEEMGCALEIASPVTLDIEYAATGDIVTFKGSVTAHIKTECALCLDKVDLKIESELHETFSRGVIEGDEAMEIHPFEGFHVDLSECVTASVILDLPMRVQCQDACKGLCPVCGINLNREVCGCERLNHSAFDALKSLSFDQEEV